MYCIEEYIKISLEYIFERFMNGPRLNILCGSKKFTMTNQHM